MDFLSTHERSARMRLVKARHTHPERVVRSLLHSRGFRFRLHYRDLPGKPDIALPKYRTVIFVNGCFWHACPNCKKGSRRPKTNAAFWANKIEKNVQRDIRSQRLIEAADWRVIVVWECETKKEDLLAKRLEKLFTDATPSIAPPLSPQSSPLPSEKRCPSLRTQRR